MPTSLTNLLPPAPETRPRSLRLLTPTTQPIPLLSNPSAAAYSHIHTPLVLAYYALRFGPLVADPLPTMIRDLLPLVLLQCAFCALCLPPAGTWASSSGGAGGATIVSGLRGGGMKGSKMGSGPLVKRKKMGGGSGGGGGVGRVGKDENTMGWQGKVVPTILSLILTLTLPPLPLAVLALILGAPLYPYSLLPHTLLLSVHVSLLAFLPIFYTHGVSSPAWRDIMAAWLPFDAAGVWGGSVGCFVGGWVGAVPMALDWDRDWQKWPCTVVVGAIVGWGLGRLMTAELRLGVGRRIDLGENEVELEIESSQAAQPPPTLPENKTG